MATRAMNSKKAGSFAKTLEAYKKLIDADIKNYAKYIRASTLEQYGRYAHLESDAFLSILERGGKRIRGTLVMVGYEMSGGKMDAKGKAMILQAARAVEMMHAYVLIIDDIQDRSALRRGDKTAHIMHRDYHQQQALGGEADHFGVAIALNSAFGGAHAANTILANLEAPEELRLNVVSIMNRTMLVTAHGQTSDIMNQVQDSVSMADVEAMMDWKSAQYTILNPLHVGMVLAGADCHATDAISPYAHHVGAAFQITDDIIGVFGDKKTSGKNPMDDIREGKRTVLTVYALEHATGKDKAFLLRCLGNTKLTKTDFARCRDIIKACGALAYAQERAEYHVNEALQSLDHEAGRWIKPGVQFLRELAQYLLTRQG